MEHSITMQEARERLGVTVTHAYRLVHQRSIPAQKVDGKWAIRPSDLEAYQRRRKQSQNGRAKNAQR